MATQFPFRSEDSRNGTRGLPKRTPRDSWSTQQHEARTGDPHRGPHPGTYSWSQNRSPGLIPGVRDVFVIPEYVPGTYSWSQNRCPGPIPVMEMYTQKTTE